MAVILSVVPTLSRRAGPMARARRAAAATLSPAQYARVTYAAVALFTIIVMTGAAVRLTGSGLGCAHWPTCDGGHMYPPLSTHAIIEFSNRLITFPVSVAAFAAWLLAYRRRPYRRDLMWTALLLPLGVAGQAILGGLTVRGDLDYGWVMGHFALSMLTLVAATVLAWRATHEPGTRPRPGDRLTVWLIRALAPLGALTIFAGTAATAAGPHAGGSPGQRIHRLAFDGHGTMDFVIHRHAEIALAFGLLAAFSWWWLQRRPLDRTVQRAVTWLVLLIGAQGFVGMIQYETHLPTELVWVHVSLACGAWIATIWAAGAAGRPAPRTAPARAPEQGAALEQLA